MSSFILLFILFALLMLVVLVGIALYNSLISTKNKVAEAFSAIDTVLQNRYDLIPNLVEVVKQYAKHEVGVLNHVSDMRAKLAGNSSQASADRFVAENELQTTMKSLFALTENYPDLKANQNFLELQTQWTEMEDRLQGARRAYNASVKIFNDKKEMFPSNIVASMMTLPFYALYEATSEARTTPMDTKKMFDS